MFNASYTDITDWAEQQHLGTLGSREKCWVINPKDGRSYFFKRSYKKQVIDYKSEFWMEIIASKIGQMLGLEMVDYNIAKRGEALGCLCCHMCKEGETLVELTKMFTGYDEDYNPEKDQEAYTFDFVVKTLRHHNLEKHVARFIEVLVFDAIIGNQDRHQDNWGMIMSISQQSTKTRRKILSFYKRVEKKWSEARVAPIYDSGSSLGRELTEEKVKQMCTDKVQFDSYVRRGKPELRWEDVKISYNELIEKLLNDVEFGNKTYDIIKRLTDKFDEEKVISIIENIDNALPTELNSQRLTADRKQFIIKLISTRVSGLKETLSNNAKK